jgi:hypothetical protein
LEIGGRAVVVLPDNVLFEVDAGAIRRLPIPQRLLG